MTSPLKVQGAETAATTATTASVATTGGARFLAEAAAATAVSAATDFATCQKKCLPKTCSKKLKVKDCKLPVQDYENCLAKETTCKALATWIASGHKTADYNAANLKACTDKCGAKSVHKANKFVKGAYVCLNNCGAKLATAAKTLPKVAAASILHMVNLVSVLIAAIFFINL